MKKTLWLTLIVVSIAAVVVAQESQPVKSKPSAARAATHSPLQTRAPESQPAATETAPAPTETATLPMGTTVRMKLETVLATVVTRVNSEWAGRVTEAVMIDGKTVIPVGASVTGHVTQSEEPRRISGVPVISIRPESVTMPNGDRFAMSAMLVDTSDPKHLHVDEEGRIKSGGHDMTDWRDTGIGVGAGTTIGAMKAGPKGALIGATIGGGVAVVRWLSRTHHSETIPAGTELFLELSRPMTMSMSGAAGR
jgi:hypothetical protein